MEKQGAYRILMGLTLSVMFLPMVQHITDWPRMKALRGDVQQVARPGFTWKHWFDGEYAPAADRYFTHNFGYRPDLVRLDNEIAMSLFGEPRANLTLEGKSGYLFERNYIEAYTGKDFIGTQEIRRKVAQMKAIQDSLQARGKQLLIVLAAGKASFYPEYIPDGMMVETDSVNYPIYRKELLRQGVNHIDFNQWFMENKGKMDYPLYPKTGIHWSEYGMALAADSLIRKVDGLLPGKRLGRLYWNEVEYTSELRGNDGDIEAALNLIRRYPNFKMGYPKIEYDTVGRDGVNLIMISDSFFWRMFSEKVMPNVFTEGQFWYYNNVSYPQHFDRHTEVRHLDFNTMLDDVEVVVMMSTEANLKYFPWGALEQWEGVLNGTYEYDAYEKLSQKLAEREKHIRNDGKWLAFVREQAKERNVPLELNITTNAIYDLKTNGQYTPGELRQFSVLEMEKHIRTTPGRMAEMQAQAKEKGVPLDETIRENAILILKENGEW